VFSAFASAAASNVRLAETLLLHQELADPLLTFAGLVRMYSGLSPIIR